MLPPLPAGWTVLQEASTQAAYRRLSTFLAQEAAAGMIVFPPASEIFAALTATPYESVRVVLLGQDPYHTPGMAHGLCFSVPPQMRALPPSLKNIHRELQADLGCRIPAHGCLSSWASQGVLLLNTVLTVRAHAAHSHRGQGWEVVTDRVIEAVNALPTRVVFLLWGEAAKKKQPLVTQPQHVVLTAAHPSPLSVRRFWGNRCFSQANRALIEAGRSPIEWQIPDL